MAAIHSFSRNAGDYARYRPRYPAALFEFLAARTPDRRRAWDCATGNGQAALGLAPYIDLVVASDASREQLAVAEPHPRVRYVRGRGEEAPLAAGSCALITVAQALHWLDLDRFFAEVRRIARPGGVFAAWSYSDLTVAPEVDAVVNRFYAETVGPYWLPERRLVDEGYAGVPFPFVELQTPPFEIRVEWALADLLGYIDTWSAVSRYREARGRDPMPELEREVAARWGDRAMRHTVRWTLHVRLGRIV